LGHEVLIAGDFNDDLNDPNSATQQFMQRVGLRELMIEKYGHGPPTHNRGLTTIDGVFATEKLHMRQGKYIKFDQSPSDHR
jgi:hypothetical protein